MRIRPAAPADADGMSAVLHEIVAATGRPRPSDPAFVLATYTGNPHRIACSVAVDADGGILGFQSLIRAVAGNAYGVEPGWGIIGTHVSPRAARRGVGKALFEVSRGSAHAAGLVAIDATIGADNATGLAYYEAMGFRTYRRADDAVSKVFLLDGRAP